MFRQGQLAVHGLAIFLGRNEAGISNRGKTFLHHAVERVTSGQESGIDLQFRIVGQVGRRRDATFFRRCKYGDKPAINDDDDDEHRGGEERRGGEKCVVAGFQRRAKKGPPSDPRAELTGVKRSPFSADYFARGALFLLGGFH